jgi:hypothetical protein
MRKSKRKPQSSLQRVNDEFGCGQWLRLPLDLLRFLATGVAAVFELLFEFSFGCLIILPLWLFLLPVRLILALINRPTQSDGFIRRISKRMSRWLEMAIHILAFFSSGDS